MRNSVQVRFLIKKAAKQMTALRLMGVLYIAISISACANLGFKAPAKGTTGVAASAQPAPQAVAKPDASQPIDATTPKPEETVFQGTGQFVKPSQSAEMPARAAMADQEVSFNFEATPVPEVVKTILGDLLQETYVIGPGVGGTVTFATARPIKGEQAMAVLEMLLSWSGAALVRKDGQYMVVQTQAAVPGNLAPKLTAPNGTGYSVYAVPLKFISATQMEELLKPYAKQGAVLKADNARSLIVLAGTRPELENYQSVIDTFDVDWMAGMSFGLFTLERVEVKDLMPELEAIFGDGTGTGAAQTPLAGVVRLLPVERLNAILVITPQPQYLNQVQQWIKRLDRGGTEGGAKLYVYDVQNVKAVDLADRLNEIFTGQAAAPRQERRTGRGETAPGLGGQTLGGVSNPNNPFQPPVQRPTPVPTPTPGSNPGGAGGSGAGKALLGEQEVKITAVEDNNALLISSTPAQYEIIKTAIRRLDIEPLQVKIEAKLLEVSLSNNLSMGVQWWLERAVPLAGENNDGPIAGIGGGGATASVPNLQLTSRNAGLGSFSGLGGVISGGGVNYIFDGRDARAFVNLLQSEGNTNVLSSPTLVVLNNKQASIQVGQQIAQNAGSATGAGGISNSFVQFRDTGIILDVTPRVNPGGLVYLEIQQQQSTVGTTPINGQAPINQKTISTEVAVQSGQTIVLGGLIQEDNSYTNGGVPGLKNLPVVGKLFGSSKKDVNRTETLVLITPTVVEGGSSKMREVTDEYVRRFKGLEPLIREGVIPPAPLKSTQPALRDGELLQTPAPQSVAPSAESTTPKK
jgi:general secretion pathway protein D